MKLIKMELEKLIKEFGKNIGLDIIRIISPEPLAKTRLYLPPAKSIIVAAQCYLTDEIPENKWPYGVIAPYTRSNYYYDTRQKLKKLAEFIEKNTGKKLKYKIFSNGPLAEKLLAQKSGIGFYGKNGIIYTEEFGSWVVLGEILIDLKLEYDKPIEKKCGECKICIEKCPTGAMIAPYVVEKSNCLQYLMEKEIDFSMKLLGELGKMTYGCTICQDTCPKNKIEKFPNRKPAYGYIGPSVNLIEILKISEDKIKEKFKNNQMGADWVSPLAIKRNAIINLGCWKDKRAVPILKKYLPHPKLKNYAEWALKQIT